MTEVEVPGARITYLLGAEDDPAAVDDFDVVVTLADGSRWSASLITMAAIERIMDRWVTTGESLSGAYFQSDDMVIVRQAGIGFATELLRRLVETDQVRYTLTRLRDDGEDD
jgi:hypothetical protein